MTLNEAAIAVICRLRKSNWANPKTYVKIDLFDDGLMGPWLHLYDRETQQLLGSLTPQTVLADDMTDDYEEYKGHIDEEDYEVIRNEKT